MNRQNNQNQTPIAPTDQAGQTPINDQSSLVVQNTSQADPITSPIITPAVENKATNEDENLEARRQKLKREQAQLDATLEETEQTGFDRLVAKYGINRLSTMVLDEKPTIMKSVVDQYLTLRQLMVSDFIKPEVMPTFPPKLKDKILTLIAALKPAENPANVQTWLNQIDPNLVLPENFQVENYQPQAYRLWQATENIKKIIVEFDYNDSFDDVKKLFLLPESQYTQFAAYVEELDQEIAKEYEPQKADQPVRPELRNKILTILDEFSRTPVFIREQKEENIFGNLVEIFLKIAYAVQIADSIKGNKLPQPNNDDTLKSAIKSYIYQNIILQ